MLVERQDKRSLSGDDLVELMGLVLGNAALAETSAELELVAAQWEAVRGCQDRYAGGGSILNDHSCIAYRMKQLVQVVELSALRLRGDSKQAFKVDFGNAILAGTSAELELVAAQWEAVRGCQDRCVPSRAAEPFIGLRLGRTVISKHHGTHGTTP